MLAATRRTLSLAPRRRGCHTRSRPLADSAAVLPLSSVTPPAFSGLPRPAVREPKVAPSSRGARVALPGVDPSLLDTFGRAHRYLRVSLTDRCNMACKYCSPEEGEEPALPSASGKNLTAEEISRVLRLFVGLGVTKIRLTGGEPTIRGDFERIIKDLGELHHSVDKPLTLGITTNGVRLSKFLPSLRQAGLHNINLSLDTLIASKFPFLVRREMKWHVRVMDALHEMLEEGSPFNVKVNCVLLRGVNEDEIGAFVDLTERLPVEVRFLEFMPFDRNEWSAKRLVPQAEIAQAIQRHVAARGFGVAERLPPETPNDVARLWQVPGWRGRIGIIASMTDAFCGGCNRLRVTAEGEIRNCLFGEEGWSLRDAMRSGADDDALRDTVASAVAAKFAKLGGKRDMHELRERRALNLPMMSLGG